jgi:hypothetical protein
MRGSRQLNLLDLNIRFPGSQHFKQVADSKNGIGGDIPAQSPFVLNAKDSIRQENAGTVTARTLES